MIELDRLENMRVFVAVAEAQGFAEVIDRAIESGFLVAAPTEEACGRCDFRPVCGSDVFRRVGRKPQENLADLAALRSRP